MKRLSLCALLAIGASTYAQTIIQDNWDTGPSITSDGRDGFRHNFNRPFPADNYTGPLSPGDSASRVIWQQLNNNGALLGQEAGAGSGDWWVVADKFLVNSGNFLGLTAATFEFSIARNSPASTSAASTTVATNSVFQIRVYGLGSEYVERRWRVSDMPAGFWTTAFQNVFVPSTVNLLDPTGWVGVNGGTHASVMANASQIVIYYDIIGGAERHYLDDVKLSYNTGSGPQTVISDFNAAPVFTADGREGWRHNGAENPLPFVTGDTAGTVQWSLENLDSVANGLADTGVILAFDPANGNGDNFIAPDRYMVPGGRFDMLATGLFNFDFFRVAPTGSVTTTSQGSLDAIIFVSPTGHAARYRFSAAELNAMATWGASSPFFSAAGIRRMWPISVDVNNKAKFVLSTPSGAAPKPLEEILANVAVIQVGGEIRSGSETNGIDNFKFEYTLRNKISGTMSFNDRMDRFPGGSLVLFMQPGTTTEVWRGWAKRNATTGTYELPQGAPAGTYDLVADPALSFLRSRVNNVVVGASDVTGVNFNFRNGDVDNSTEVDLTDIDLLIAAYLLAEGQPGFSDALDVDGSGEIDLTDIDIAIANYLQADE